MSGSRVVILGLNYRLRRQPDRSDERDLKIGFRHRWENHLMRVSLTPKMALCDLGGVAQLVRAAES